MAQGACQGIGAGGSTFVSTASPCEILRIDNSDCTFENAGWMRARPLSCRFPGEALSGSGHR